MDDDFLSNKVEEVVQELRKDKRYNSRDTYDAYQKRASLFYGKLDKQGKIIVVCLFILLLLAVILIYIRVKDMSKKGKIRVLISLFFIIWISVVIMYDLF